MFTAGRFDALGAATFFIGDFPSTRLPPVLYQESVTSVEIIERPSLVREYSVAPQEACRVALGREESLAAIRQAETEL
jgi:hypothetical protein